MQNDIDKRKRIGGIDVQGEQVKKKYSQYSRVAISSFCPSSQSSSILELQPAMNLILLSCFDRSGGKMTTSS